ncbi:MAG TPA: glycoside hydrolase family 3 N-terminal domain-containing protein [Solirubrobacterales bacterium]
MAIAIAALSSGGEDPRPEARAAVPPECAGDAPRDLRRRLGQRLVVRMEGEATPALLRQARAGEIGGVVLFPPSGQDPGALAGEIERLQTAAAESGGPPLVVAIDQEGGEVKRLASLPPDVAPPELAGDPAAAEEQGLATGEALARIGVNVDLAPVLDVPASPDSFVAARSFGDEAASVAAAGTAFASGLRAGGVEATAKHFPGLGRSAANTDLEPSEVAGGRGRLAGDLEPFRSAIDAGIGLVMLSSAAYPALDPGAPAFGSPAIADELLRGGLGFEGVTITDDLGAGAVRASQEPPEAALTAAAGGSDLLLFALDPRPDVLGELVAAAERGELDPAAVGASCARIASLRAGFAG